MSAVATSSFSRCIKRHISSSDDSDGDLSICKKPRQYFYILEPETTDYSTDGNESIYSIQQRTTDTAKDTSDTETKSEDSMVEFEIVSDSDDAVYPFSKDSSSLPEDTLNRAITFENDEGPYLFSSDASDSSPFTPGESSLEERRFRKPYLFKMCVQCGQANGSVFYRYCSKCYKVRKNFFPPRPKGKKKQKTDKGDGIDNSATDDAVRSSQDSGINSEFAQSLSGEPLEERMENCSDQDLAHRKELCGTCLVRIKDRGYVHNNIVHVYSCYRCSVKTLKQIGRCPICNLRVRQICRVITI